MAPARPTAAPAGVVVAGSRLGWPAIALLLFVALLPLHVLAITMLLDAGVPVPLLRALAAWKEAVVVGVLATLLWRRGRALTRSETWRSLRWPDWCALLLLAQAIVYVLLPQSLFGPVSEEAAASSGSLVGRLYALRDAAFWVAIYLCGRCLPSSRRLERAVLLALAAVGAVGSVAGLIERFFVPLEAFVALGIVEYHNTFLNLTYPTTPYNPWGLPENFFSGFGPQVLRRAVSIHLSAQPFALSYLLTLPVTLVLMWQARGWRQRALLGLVVLSFAALDLTLTRASIAACLVQLAVLLAVLMRQVLRPLLISAGVALLLLLGIAFVAGWVQALVPAAISTLIHPADNGDSDINSAWATLVTANPSRAAASLAVRQAIRGDDPSTEGHRSAWSVSLRALAERPLFGHGLGTAGLTALRFNPNQIGTGGESMYFKYTGEMGLTGLGLFLGAFFGVIAFGARQVWRDWPLSLGKAAAPLPGKVTEGERAQGEWVQRPASGSIPNASGLRQGGGAAALRVIAFPLAVTVAGIGIAVAGISTPLFDVPFMGYVFWWLGGMVVARDPNAPGGDTPLT